MTALERFSAEDVMLDVSVKNKQELFENLAAAAAARLGHSREDVLDALLSREELGTTALGKGVALPHAELEGAASPIMLIARLRRAIEFDAADGEPVDLAFVFLWPASATKSLLDAMSQICRVLRQPALPHQLRLAKTRDEVARIIRGLERLIGEEGDAHD